MKVGPIGAALFAALTLLCGIQTWRHREPAYLFFGLALRLFGFFMVMGGQHERYLFLVIPLALASLTMVRRERSGHLVALCVLGTVLCLLNMLVGVGGGIASGFANSQLLPLLNLPALGTYVSTNFRSLSETIAFLAACHAPLRGICLPVGWRRAGRAHETIRYPWRHHAFQRTSTAGGIDALAIVSSTWSY
ncbi:MAG TPA: hypothetical protein VGP82_09060 [Ktedonobacterales bacterium]|nr:hypothetical protein [Ktedonobacterales bacterium]